MSVGVFTDKRNRPIQAEVRTAIGPLLAAWDGLVASLRETYAPDEDFAFMYGKTYGWALRFRARKQLLTSLYPADGHFKVQVNLSPEAVERALTSGLGSNARRAIDAAHPYPEGRWVFVAVESQADVEDVRQLVALRAADKRLLRR